MNDQPPRPAPSPPPRSSHQAVMYKSFLFVFGGEFSSPSGERFRHYRDLWRLDSGTWQWEELSIRGGPTARSGHRMVGYKSRLVVFGGFYDTGKDVR